VIGAGKVILEALAIIGAITGIVGALTGLASLRWQVVTLRRSGRLVEVTCSYNTSVYGVAGAPQRGRDDQVTIKVTNAGGAPVTVTNYGVRMGGKDGRNCRNCLTDIDPAPWSTKLPYYLEPGGEPAQLSIPVDALRKEHRKGGVPFYQMWPWVDLGDGLRVDSKQAVPLL
jgi:hypothetical protein